MTRRAILAALTGLVVWTNDTQAQTDPFPLAPRPNPCGEPFIRKREEEPDRAEQFKRDLIVWSYEHQNIRTAYAGLRPELKELIPPGETMEIGGVTFRFMEAPTGLMPESDLWFITADCGQLL